MEIFPKEIIENTVQAYVPKNKTKSKVIYGIILLLLCTVFISLPFIKIKIYTTSRGVIKPDQERIAINSINSGKVLYSDMHSNKYVKQGDVLLAIKSDVLDDQIALTEYETQKFTVQSEDLKYLINDKNISSGKIKSPKYRKEYFQYQEKKNEYNTRLKKIKVDYERNKLLLSKGVIAKVEYEDIKLEYDLALNSFYQFRNQQISTWQATLSELETFLITTGNKNSQYKKAKSEYIITAPLDGTLINISGIEKGSIISSGAILGEISPDTELLAECYISPLDIGLIRESKPVRFQIDAFNYNQWGLATGNIIDISEDVEIIDNQPIFKAKCRINEEYLLLKNGAKGKLGKGMTFNARFELAERSLYQLLYDKIDDWINPGLEDKVASTK
ncbi:HlyD family efflux transporter periplasmic adaptor subunit [uncultured Eudoraea sp.]|uniref:HlyD family secretion protein n=1 Tax=uncultured Eudoraea sp. TaxID=1035614 RepID=UPI0026375982|nr:HlyD family efflux transporter periplasmic adaptor subunit [uncultured Eudoraea sp.]